MDNEATLVEIINAMLAEPDRQQALGYIEGVGFKLKGAEYRIKKLTDEVDRFCARKETDEFYFRVEWDHFITCLRSAFDYLAQLINVVYGLELLPSHRLRKGDVVDFKTVVKHLDDKEPGNKLTQLLKKTSDSEWYKCLNDLRIETIHVKPVPTAKEMTACARSKARIAEDPLAKKSDDETREITQLRGGRAQLEEEEQPRGGIGPRIEKLLLPDEPGGNTWEKRIELVFYCETRLANIRGIVQESYAPLIHRLEGSK